MARTDRPAETHDMEAPDSPVQIGYLLGRNKVSEVFTTKALKCLTDDKLHKSSSNR